MITNVKNYKFFKKNYKKAEVVYRFSLLKLYSPNPKKYSW